MARKTLEIAGSPYCYEDAQREALEKLADRVKTLRQSGSLSPEVLGHIRKFFRLKSIYNSNAIEGNALDLGETKLVVEQGLTITGKPLKDQAEAKNLAEALSFLEQIAAGPKAPISELDVRQIHGFVLKDIDDDNAGRYRSVPVEISGSQFNPPGPESVPPQMAEFGRWLSEASLPKETGAIEGVLNAAVAHTWFVCIHPFIDGNGRVARLLMNLILMRCGYPIAIIAKEDRLRYYDSLEDSQASDLSSFLALLVECIHESLEEYERAADEQREREEWIKSLAQKFSEKETIRYRNEYEVWKSSMELLKSYFRQTCEMLGESATGARTYFKEFGVLEFEKYMSLRDGDSVKRTWFFRIDFRTGDKAARYLFFFGFPSYILRQDNVDVTLHVAREEPPGSFVYERLDQITAPNCPSIHEIGYKAKDERYVSRDGTQHKMLSKVETLGQRFFEEVIQKHFTV